MTTSEFGWEIVATSFMLGLPTKTRLGQMLTPCFNHVQPNLTCSSKAILKYSGQNKLEVYSSPLIERLEGSQSW